MICLATSLSVGLGGVGGVDEEADKLCGRRRRGGGAGKRWGRRHGLLFCRARSRSRVPPSMVCCGVDVVLMGWLVWVRGTDPQQSGTTKQKLGQEGNGPGMQGGMWLWMVVAFHEGWGQRDDDYGGDGRARG